MSLIIDVHADSCSSHADILWFQVCGNWCHHLHCFTDGHPGCVATGTKDSHRGRICSGKVSISKWNAVTMVTWCQAFLFYLEIHTYYLPSRCTVFYLGGNNSLGFMGNELKRGTNKSCEPQSGSWVISLFRALIHSSRTQGKRHSFLIFTTIPTKTLCRILYIILCINYCACDLPYCGTTYWQWLSGIKLKNLSRVQQRKYETIVNILQKIVPCLNLKYKLYWIDICLRIQNYIIYLLQIYDYSIIYRYLLISGCVLLHIIIISLSVTDIRLLYHLPLPADLRMCPPTHYNN